MPKAQLKLAPAEDEEKVDESKFAFAGELGDQTTEAVCVGLLMEAEMIKARMDRDKQRLDELKGELLPIIKAFSIGGLRHGRIGLAYYGMRSKKYLDKLKLIENGVDPELISNSYSQGREYEDVRFVPFK